jgi:hypothetical protein
MLPIQSLTGILNTPLYIPKELGIDWLLVSDIEAFKNLNIDFANYYILEKNIEKAHSILFHKGYFIYAVYKSTLLSDKGIMKYLDNIYEIRKILK